ncbi:hypothetical protein [Aliirhizobium smilacinae]|uniref:Uncharacterized protein n=1 Tax=Aliirhizobium smilacinae TaxID=1395944 RepID=A0A5C4XUX4_9HYPH|nr:hypothetical protein [Rhizobium smilacinae]TNM66484.1 hypothetical protein FHP24_09885 [Rhizobium smilacinae]
MLLIDFLSYFNLFLVFAGALIGVFLNRVVQALVDRGLRQQTIKLEWEQKKREQAARVAEYMSYAWQLRSDDTMDIYRKTNQLGWELAMYLPAELYTHVRDGVMDANDKNPLSAILAARKHLLKDERDALTLDDIAFHFPNAKVISKAVEN